MCIRDRVKEPLEPEFEYLRPGLALFTFLHLAGYPKVADALIEREVTSIAYETVQTASGALPLLAPMSEVAGRMSVQVGANLLERHHGGRGVLMGGVPGVRPARVAVIGAGNVGWNAARTAAGLDADVDLLDKSVDRLRWVDEIHNGRVRTLTANRGQVERTAAEADLLIGEGFIEPHFFAGFSGGRKSVLPGVVSYRTVLANHCAEFIASPHARTGVLENNPLHRDMLHAAKAANLGFIINVVINADKKIIKAFAGHREDAHLQGCEFVRELAGVKKVEEDIAVTTHGGYPLEQNI